MFRKVEKNRAAKCAKYESQLEDYLSSDLRRGDGAKVSAHLNECHECREALQDGRVASRLVSAVAVNEDVGPAFTRRVMAQAAVAEQWIEQQKKFWRPIESLAWRLAFSAVLALALLFAYGLRAVVSPSAATATTAFGQRTEVVATPVSVAPATDDEVLMAIAEKHHGQQ